MHSKENLIQMPLQNYKEDDHDDVHEELLKIFDIKHAFYTERQLRQIERVCGFLSDDELADYLGVSVSTLKNRIKTDEEFASAYRMGRAKPIVQCGEVVLNKAVYDNDLNAAMFYLKTKGKWKENQQLSHSVEVKQPPKLSDFYGTKIESQPKKLLGDDNN